MNSFSKEAENNYLIKQIKDPFVILQKDNDDMMLEYANDSFLQQF